MAKKNKLMKDIEVAARRSRRDPDAVNETLEDEDSETELPNIKDLEAEEKLAVFHKKFGGEDYKIRVEVFNKEENEWEMVANLKLAGFDSFDSLKKYGAGRYRMSLLDNGGLYVAGGRMECRISAAAVEAAKADAPAAPPPDNGMTAIVAMLQAQNAQNLEMIKALIGRPVPTEKAPSITELIAGMAGIRNLMPKEEGMSGVKGTLELMKLMKEITPAPAEGGEGGVMDEVSRAVELFTKVSPLIEARRRGAPAAPAVPVAPASAQLAGGAVHIPTPQPAEEAEADPMKPIIEKAQSYVPQLVAWASRGKDIDDAAYFVLDEIEAEIVPALVKNFRPGGMTLSPEYVFGELLKRAQDPAQVEAIFIAAPALAPYKEWFTRVINRAVEIETTPEDPAPAEVNGNVA